VTSVHRREKEKILLELSLDLVNIKLVSHIVKQT